ncbi:MAG: acyl-CoA dehydrogenase [Rhodospirillales bacterium]|nr:acyl-CoA dehydrogenase [Rhodospirillales bacterium]
MLSVSFLIGLAFFIGLLFLGQPYLSWVAGTAIYLLGWYVSGIESPVFFTLIAVAAIAAAVFFATPVLRRQVLTRPIMVLVRKILPTMGETERIALEAGTVWWDGDLFTGKPDWNKLLDFNIQKLSEKEREFLEGPVEELCRMLNDWEIAQARDLSPEVWDFIKKNNFFGMIIPEEYGGLGFSAIAHSAVVTKVSSRSVTAAVTIMVPNSLGPAELLLHYGTDEQKNHYLPRLAIGEEVPCFALTEPHAGSDATATRSTGVVCKGTHEGAEVLGIRLNWAKRYITLAPVATVIGLSFRLSDPDGLLDGEKDLGITCALIPRDTAGMEIGNRHDPMGVPFQNGPIFGRDVFIPLDFVIGGRAGLGQGWRMLMESLAAGRSISLPALSVGATELAARVTGAYGTVREQFNMPIGKFEGIEERLSRIGGYAYLMNGARTLTCGAVDAGEKPAVVSAIVKAYLTEAMREALNDAMDIRAGAAISRGPKNIIGRGFVSHPISITVEGANILTRTLIIFGQGAIRCHPYVHEEMEAIAENDLARFDKAFFGHVGFVFQNMVRSFLLGLTFGRLVRAPLNGVSSSYFGKLTRFSAAFALITDLALATMGGSLKRKEKISGRMADALAWMYLGSAALKKFYDEDQPERDAAALQWSLDLSLYNIQEALRRVLDNFPNRPAAWALYVFAFPFGFRHRPPRDSLGAKVAQGLLEDGEFRLHVTSDIFIPPQNEEGLGRLEAALDAVVKAASAKNKIKNAVRTRLLADMPDTQLRDEAVKAGIITADEQLLLEKAEKIQDEVVQVDVFDPETYTGLKG